MRRYSDALYLLRQEVVGSFFLVTQPATHWIRFTGIGPCAPVILAKKVPLCLLWTSPDVRKTFGDHLVDSILEAAPKAVLHGSYYISCFNLDNKLGLSDTRRDGKPDMIQLTYRLYKEFNAEAVCVISNQKLTRKIVYGMKSRGIPAFGAIWDS